MKLAGVMPGLVPGIHVLNWSVSKDVDGRDIGERSDAVLRTAMPGHDEMLLDVERSHNCPSSVSPPETSTLPGLGSRLNFFTTPSSTSIE